MLLMGIDGGGSNLRVVITDTELNSLAEAYRGTVNPNIIGYDDARQLIQSAIRDALAQLDAPQIAAVGIGIAGAPNHVAEDWLRAVVSGVLPQTQIIAASDNEIALVGALGKRQGLLLLAGTGSVGFGINAAGETLQVGGWGYLLDDSGSGYWLGQQALKLVTQAIDNPALQSPLIQRVCAEYALHSTRDVLQLVYHTDGIYTPRIAKLAPFVLQAADEGDSTAIDILERGSTALANLAELLRQRLNMPAPDYAFAGGLLSNENAYSRRLLAKLGLESLPQAQYPPMLGAALLAKLSQAVQHE